MLFLAGQRYHMGMAGSAKFISLKHKYHILLTNNLHGEIL